MGTLTHSTLAPMERAGSSDISVGGPGLAAQALVDELRLFVASVVVGSGPRWLPDDLHLTLALLEERRFTNGMAHLRYRVTQ